MRKIAVISLSGGMDSTALLIKLISEKYEIYGVSFDYGQKHKIELERLKENLIYLALCGIRLKDYNVINVSQIGNLFDSSLLNKDKEVPTGHYEEENMKSTVVPNRNAIFSSIIYGYALSISQKLNQKVEIFLGVHSGDHAIYPDCRPEFYFDLEQAFQTGNWNSENVSFELPYLNSNKTGILEDCLFNCEKTNIDFNIIMKNTNTSYNPNSEGKSSGTSGADIERIEAFINIGMKDPVEYVEGWDKAKENALKILNKNGNI